MADRIIGMRTALRENLEKLGSTSNLSWRHITDQVDYCPLPIYLSPYYCKLWFTLMFISHPIIILVPAIRLACSATAVWPLSKSIAWRMNTTSTWLVMAVSGTIPPYQCLLLFEHLHRQSQHFFDSTPSLMLKILNTVWQVSQPEMLAI